LPEVPSSLFFGSSLNSSGDTSLVTKGVPFSFFSEGKNKNKDPTTICITTERRTDILQTRDLFMGDYLMISGRGKGDSTALTRRVS
jgi:hypothetical protein